MLPKLVRNFIPEIISENQKIPSFYQASDEEYWKRLKSKLIEEVNEFIDSENNINEIADILEVIEAIISFKKMSLDEIIDIKKKKAEAHGTFSEKIILASIKEP